MKPPKPRICAIVVSYNSAGYLPGCLDSLKRQTHGPLDIVLVDNASKDGSAEIARARGVHVIENDQNLGYATANNQGLRYALERLQPADRFLLMNADTISDEHLVEELLATLSRSDDYGIAQGKLLLMREPGLLNASGIRHHFLYFGSCEGYRRPDDIAADAEYPVASGACLMFKREVLERLGYLFNEEFFMYHEDTDFCLRARLAGFKTVASARAVAFHDYRLGTSKTKFFHMEKNRLYLVLQNYRWTTLLMLLPALAFTEPQVLAYATMKGWGSWKLRSYAWLARNHRSIAQRRREVESLRVVDDEVMVRQFAGELSLDELDNPLVRYLTNPALKAYKRLALRWLESRREA